MNLRAAKLRASQKKALQVKVAQVAEQRTARDTVQKRYQLGAPGPQTQLAAWRQYDMNLEVGKKKLAQEGGELSLHGDALDLRDHTDADNTVKRFEDPQYPLTTTEHDAIATKLRVSMKRHREHIAHEFLKQAAAAREEAAAD